MIDPRTADLINAWCLVKRKAAPAPAPAPAPERRIGETYEEVLGVPPAPAPKPKKRGRPATKPATASMRAVRRWREHDTAPWPMMPDMSRIEVLPPRDYDAGETIDCDTILIDPPYIGTHDYGVRFDHERLASWCNARPERVLVSNSPEALPLFPGWHVTHLSAKGGIGRRRDEVLLWNGK